MINESSLSREQILNALTSALEPLTYTYAMWEAGAAAFGRVDEWSDLDLLIDVEDERVEDAFSVIEKTLAALSPIDLKYELPQPTWHGHAQTFYRLSRAGKFLLLDIAVIKHSSPNKFLEAEQHGQPVVYFDKSGVVKSPPFNPETFRQKLQDRLENLRITFDLFQVLILKELHRGNAIEALAFYHGFTLRPLVEVLRIQYQPKRHNFYTRYVYYDLPGDVVQRLESFFFVKDTRDLQSKRQNAEAWFFQTLEQIRNSGVILE